jgi:hypothetical protein
LAVTQVLRPPASPIPPSSNNTNRRQEHDHQQLQQERDELLKQQEVQARNGAYSTTFLDDNQNDREIEFNEERHQAQVLALGLVLGDTEAIQTQIEFSQSANTNTSSATNDDKMDSTISLHLPESEQAVRQRFRAAALAMGSENDEETVEEDEAQLLKSREREEREFIFASGSTSVGGDGGHEQVPQQGYAFDAADDDEIKRKAKYSSVIADAGDAQLKAKEADKLYASYPSTDCASVTSSTDVTAPPPPARKSRPQVMPGAVAIQDGQAQRLAKSTLPSQPRPAVATYQEPNNFSSLPEQTIMREATSAIAASSTTSKLPQNKNIISSPYNGSANEEEQAVVAITAPVMPYNLDKNDGGNGGGDGSSSSSSSHRWKWMVGVALVLVVIIIIVIVAVVSSGKKTSSSSPDDAVTTAGPNNQTLFVDSERYKFIKSELDTEQITPMAILEDSTTPQHDALVWVSEEDIKLSSLSDMAKTKTRYVLAVFYYALGGPYWTDDDYDGWLDPNKDECEWKGVTCYEPSKTVVKEITISDPIGISGKVPGEMRHLTGLSKRKDIAELF